MSAAGEQALRSGIVATARAMNAVGINRGRSGNVSARLRHEACDGFLITPTGFRYDAMGDDDLVAVALEGTATGPHLPSSEWRFHRDIYRERPDVAAIVHTHAPFATTLACLDRGIPPFHYMIARAGGRDIRCAPYATFGTQELSDAALAALDGRRACLLAHHGALAFGKDLDDALRLADKVEALARLYWQAIQVAEPAILDDAEMARIVERFRHYGPR